MLFIIGSCSPTDAFQATLIYTIPNSPHGVRRQPYPAPHGVTEPGLPGTSDPHRVTCCGNLTRQQIFDRSTPSHPIWWSETASQFFNGSTRDDQAEGNWRVSVISYLCDKMRARIVLETSGQIVTEDFSLTLLTNCVASDFQSFLFQFKRNTR
jgi:hypothetical protein